MMRVCQRQRRLLWYSLRESLSVPRFLKFLHVDIQSTGRTLSRPWSRRPNDVMSEIQCAQLHSELLRCRHSTQQSHGLLVLAKHLLICDILALQSARMSEIKNGRLGLYHAEYSKCNQYHKTNFKFHKVVLTHYLGEVENIYNTLW